MGFIFLQHQALPKHRRVRVPRLGVEKTPMALPALLPGPDGIAHTSPRCPLPPQPRSQTNTDISLWLLNKAQLPSLGPALVLCRIVYFHPKRLLRKGQLYTVFPMLFVASAWVCLCLQGTRVT